MARATSFARGSIRSLHRLSQRQHGAWSYGLRRVDRAEAERLEPNLVAPPDLALHVAEEGTVEPRPAALALLEDAERRGTRFRPHMAVKRLVLENGGIAGVDTETGPLPAPYGPHRPG